MKINIIKGKERSNLEEETVYAEKVEFKLLPNRENHSKTLLSIKGVIPEDDREFDIEDVFYMSDFTILLHKD